MKFTSDLKNKNYNILLASFMFMFMFLLVVTYNQSDMIVLPNFKDFFPSCLYSYAHDSTIE